MDEGVNIISCHNSAVRLRFNFNRAAATSGSSSLSTGGAGGLSRIKTRNDFGAEAADAAAANTLEALALPLPAAAAMENRFREINNSIVIPSLNGDDTGPLEISFKTLFHAVVNQSGSGESFASSLPDRVFCSAIVYVRPDKLTV